MAHFSKPPLAEVVFGVAYKALGTMKAGHIGAYWCHIRDDYPTCEHVPPLGSAPPASKTWGIPLPRTWFVSRDETHLVQLQDGRFRERLGEMARDLADERAKVDELPSWEVVRRCAELICAAEDRGIPVHGWGVCPDGGCGLAWVGAHRLVTLEVWNDGEALVATTVCDADGDPELWVCDWRGLDDTLPRIEAFLDDGE